MKEKLTCIVCGKKFPRGQGIVLNVGGKEYPFHSKACALKFLRRVLEELKPEEVSKAFEKVEGEFREELRLKEEKTRKRILD